MPVVVSLKKAESLSSSSIQLPITPARVELPAHSTFHACSGFVNADTIAVSSYVKLHCCFHKILFPYSHAPLLAFKPFCSLFHMNPQPWEEMV